MDRLILIRLRREGSIAFVSDADKEVAVCLHDDRSHEGLFRRLWVACVDHAQGQPG